MQFLNKVQMLATVTTPKTYTITSTATGHNTAPEGVVSEFFISDATNSGFGVIGKMVSGVLNVARTTDGTDIPTLSSPVLIVSSMSATTINRWFYGKAGVLIIGQSQVIGYNTGKDLAIDYTDPRMTEFIPNVKHRVLAAEPLDHNDANTTDGRSNVSVSFALHYGREILNSGVGHVEFIARAAGSTAFYLNQWNLGDTLFEAAVTRLQEYFAAGEGRYLHSIVMDIGESDTLWGNFQSSAVFDDKISAFIPEFRARVLTVTGVDISKVPIIFLGMAQNFIDIHAVGPDNEAVLASMPTKFPYIGYIPTAAWAVQGTGGNATTNAHHNADTVRTIGAEYMYPAYETALANPLGDVVPTGPNTGTIVGNIQPLTVTSSGNAAAPAAPVTGTIVGNIQPLTMVASGNSTLAPVTGTIVGNIQPLTMVASGNAAAAPAASFVVPDFLLQTGVEIMTVADTSGHQGIAQWGSTVGTDYVENTGTSFTPVNNVAGAEYTGSDAGILNFPNAAANYLDNASGLTIMIDCTPTAIGTSDDLFRGVQNNLAVSGTSRLQGTTLTHTALTNNVRATLTLSLDRAGDTLKAYSGGVEIGSMTGLSALAAEGTAVNSTGIGSIFSNGFVGIIHNVYIYKGAITLAEADASATEYFT